MLRARSGEVGGGWVVDWLVGWVRPGVVTFETRMLRAHSEEVRQSPVGWLAGRFVGGGSWWVGWVGGVGGRAGG